MITASPPVEVLNIEGITVVRPGPAIANLFEAQLEHLAIATTLAEALTPPRRIIDLQHVRMIGSAFPGRMVAVHRILSARPDGQFVLCNQSPLCSTAVGVSKLDTVLNVLPTLEDAVTSLR